MHLLSIAQIAANNVRKGSREGGKKKKSKRDRREEKCKLIPKTKGSKVELLGLGDGTMESKMKYNHIHVSHVNISDFLMEANFHAHLLNDPGQGPQALQKRQS